MTLEQVLTRVETAIRENTDAVRSNTEVIMRPLLVDQPGFPPRPDRYRAFRPSADAIANVRCLTQALGINRETISAIEAVCTWAERSP